MHIKLSDIAVHTVIGDITIVLMLSVVISLNYGIDTCLF